ncbi:TB22B protein, partial [Polypterus senegalus]
MSLPNFSLLPTREVGELVMKDEVENFDVSSLPEEALRNIEADSFWCMSKLLDGIQDNYTFAQPGIQRKVKALEELVSRIDDQVHKHLHHYEVEYLQFAFRWMNNLLMRELPLRCTIRLWDTYQTDLDQMGESTDSSGPQSATSSPAESKKGSEGAIVSADVDSSPIGEDYLKLERAGKSAASITQLREPGAAGTPASAKSAVSSMVQEGTIELSELKVLLAELMQDIKKSEKANEKATAKALERLKQEMKQANEWL